MLQEIKVSLGLADIFHPSQSGGSTPSKLRVSANVLLPLSSPPFTSRPTPPSHKADLIKCTLSNNDHISRVVFLHGGCISLSLSLSPAFLPSWKASTREASMKMKGLDVAPLPPSLPPSANPKGARREGKDGGIYVRNGKYSCESSYICQQTFHATVALIFDPLKNAPGEEWDDYHRGKGRNFKVNIELRRGQNDYDETWNVSEGRR